MTFLPVQRMRERASLARDDSDTAYFFELLYLGELVIKMLTLEAHAALHEERERHRYSLEHRLVRAESIGEWASALDDTLTGPASQHFVPGARDSRSALTQNFGPAEDSWQRRAVDQLSKVCIALDGNYEDLSKTKVSARNWIRQFAWLRNRTRGHGAPKGATLSEITPTLQASLDEVINNAPAFTRSWAYLRRSLSGKYRVSVFGGGREPFSHLAQETQHTLAEGAYVYLDEARPAPLLFSDPDLSDFFLPNGNFRNGCFEVLSYISDDTRTEDGSGYLLPATAQPGSETAAAPALDVVGDVFTNMPPQREGYVRRATLEAELATVLNDSRHPVITLQGRGGVGKTSLALAVLHDLALAGECFAIVWFSARDIDLLPEGPRVVRADVLSTQEVARDFYQLMGRPVGAKPEQVESYFTDCLAGKAEDGPFIFVLDNFETIRQQQELYAYLSNAVRLPNKVLITTRTRDFKADYPIEVRGMARDEYATLVEETARKLGIVQLVTRTYEDELYEESDGHPYITKVLLGEVAKAAKPLSLKRVVASKDAVLDALFDRSYAALSPAAQRVFLTLCAWRSLVPRIGLEAVLLRPDNERMDVEHALLELEQASLVEEVRAGHDSSPFLSVPLAAAIFGKKKLVTSPWKFAIDADLELVHDFGAASLGEVARGLGPRVERLARAAATRAEATGDLNGLAVLEYIATDFPPAWLNLAQLQQELGQSDAAIASTSRYLEAAPDDPDGWRRLSVLYRGAGNAVGEMHARLQLAELARPSIQDLSAAASRLNGMLSRSELPLGFDERRLMIRRCRGLLEARHQEADATDLSRLAWLCLYDKDGHAAAKWTAAGLQLEPGNDHCLNLQRKLTSEGFHPPEA